MIITAPQVIWSPPDPQQINGINQGYKVEAWYNGEVEKSIRVGPSTGDPRDDQEETFGGLQKYRTYNITVLCYTSAGDGPRSHELTVCTKQDIPGVVTNMMFESVLDSSLEVLWEPPEEPNGIILGEFSEVDAWLVNFCYDQNCRHRFDHHEFSESSFVREP